MVCATDKGRTRLEKLADVDDKITNIELKSSDLDTNQESKELR